MENYEKMQQLLKARGFQAIWLHSEVNRQYATGFHSSDGGVLILPEEAFLITDFRYIEAARAHCRSYQVIMNTRENNVLSVIATLLAERGIGELAFEDGAVSYLQLEGAKARISASFLSLGGCVETLRAQKDEEEISRIIQAQRVAEKAFSELLPLIRPGLSERQLHAELVYRLLLNGAEALSFEPIVLSGERTSLPHGSASDRKLQSGDFVLFDFGVKIGGYCSDMTRTVALGKPSEKMKTIYDIVLRANREGLRTAKSGLHWQNEIDASVRQMIADEGYGEHFGHGLGHGVGLEIHERVDGMPDKPGIASDGAVATIEPGIYLPGEFGVRIEDMVVLREDGCENLTETPKDLLVL